MSLKLYFLMLGCTPPGRNTEQHDVFFGIGHSLKDLLPQIENCWPGAGKIHIDSWREVNQIENFNISIKQKEASAVPASNKLFFLNLGGYKPGDMEEYHYKYLTVAANKGEAVQRAKKIAFYKHTGFKGATSHIDDKYGVDVDDVYEIADILPEELKEKYTIAINASAEILPEDELHIGYLKLSLIAEH